MGQAQASAQRDRGQVALCYLGLAGSSPSMTTMGTMQLLRSTDQRMLGAIRPCDTARDEWQSAGQGGALTGRPIELRCGVCVSVGVAAGVALACEGNYASPYKLIEPAII